MKETSLAVWKYIKEHDGEDFTLDDISDALDMGKKQVNGIIVAALQRHRDEDKNIVPLVTREEVTVENDEGKKAIVKFIRLTDEGRDFDFAE